MTAELAVDMAACDGYGGCAELLPELIQLDPWGYPIIVDGVVSAELVGHARRAARYCPKLALTLRLEDA
jgi:ferredoxin